MHGTCWVCGQQFCDTTTCPSCISAYLDDINANQEKLVQAGLWGIDFREWGKFVKDGILKQQGKISEQEFLARKKKNLADTRERLRKKAENEARHRAQNLVNCRSDAYR